MMLTWRCQKLVAANECNQLASEETKHRRRNDSNVRAMAWLAGSGFGRVRPLVPRQKSLSFSPSRPRIRIFRYDDVSSGSVVDRKTLGCGSRTEPDGPVLPLRWIQGLVAS
jgi:hypothetical protein